ncbi:methyl-accepting chemotaxis protein [uncultured Tateyamaria sp.]|uniref:methyl-accepting chemotaxis protein n=1 Tax=uncultured Tateyamaria sp. TaxID=455651 RepID=UPI0026312DD2|nr:methyl-accepting chemotaxis protein [uncultured Tateyamaria sp.]
MTQMPRFDTAPPDDPAALFAQRRTAIDLIATSRAKTIRVALFATYLYRPHPTHPEDDKTRAGWRGVVREQFDEMDRLCTILTGRDPLDEVPSEICTWIAEHGAANPDAVAAFRRTRDLTGDILRAAETDNQTDLGVALEAHKAYGRSGFFEKVTGFCDGLWAHLDENRHQEVMAAKSAAAAISRTLTRLEHIGKHVRLVSLNASVEAARVGDAGRGLGVIAVEFKSLAEEIQHLAVTAGADIRKMAGGTDSR